MSRRNGSLNEYRRQLDVSQEQLASVSEEPSSQWMDESCRRYSLRHLAVSVVKVDRLKLYGSTSHERRRANHWPPGAQRMREREYTR